MKIAAIAHAPARHADWAELEAKIESIVADAGADLVVFPEYAGVEAALVAAPDTMSTQDWRDLTAARAEEWVAMMVRIAARQGCHVMAGTILQSTPRGIVNRAWLIAPDGGVFWQDKLILTPYERDVLRLTPGEGLRACDTALGRLGILICYDSEFPLLARALVETGVETILVPSCTDFQSGQTRVRQSCRARAIEGQCLVVQSPLVGGVAGCDIVDVNTGRPGIFAPPDHGLPPDGILAQGAADVAGMAVADIDPAAITRPRLNGQVGNFRHWPEQDRHSGPVEMVAMG